MTPIPYQLIRSNRKSIALELTPAGDLIVRAPARMPLAEIQTFVTSKQDWIESHRAKLAAVPAQPRLTMEEINALADAALADLPPRVRRFAPLVGVTYGRITVRNQRSLWGSCSAQGNLNFNCLLMLCPPAVRDYVVVHELCHRLEMNHSPAFWAQVARVLPEYETHRQWLSDQGRAIIARIR